MKSKKDLDIFRDTWIRYSAFASDFGEALRPFLSKNAYLGSYGIVAAYALADTLDRGFKAYWQTQAFPVTRKASTNTAAARQVLTRRRQPLKIIAAAPAPKVEQQRFLTPVSATVVDSLLWHGAASLALPFMVINRTVWAAGKVLARHHSHLSPALHHALPTLAGLAMIPLAVPHIDHAVTQWMDTKVRPHLSFLEIVTQATGNKLTVPAAAAVK
ncbi:hypothetical protein Ndes2526B_g04128 [Nannochloris sp. 'desiccata']